jgi:hypothetical protein
VLHTPSVLEIASAEGNGYSSQHAMPVFATLFCVWLDGFEGVEAGKGTIDECS